MHTDGAEVIFDHAKGTDDEALLTVVRTGQQHFAEVIKQYLRPITYGEDGWAERIQLTKAAAGIWSTNRAIRDDERTLTLQAEISDKRAVTDQQAGAPARKVGASATPERA